ncbi:MAG: hypothetical protein EOP45_18255 [Sphingobacteriaceae bacterium]|nr:MAG: hypothetical protein EOP45_18255 [Sphingobacteriaceae bacterium]
MVKNKYFEFATLLMAVIVTRTFDIIGTFYYTPNLKAELNPMVRLFGFQWVGIISLQVAAIIFVACINYYSLFRTAIIPVGIKGLNFHGFLSSLYFNELTPWKWKYVVTKPLLGKNQALNMYGWLIPRILIYVGIVLMFFFTLLDFIPAYRQIHKFFVVPMYLLMFSAMPVCYYWYHKFRYEKYKCNNEQSADNT